MSIALLTLMERLSPAERAAFVLREAFAYSHGDIAEILDTSVANARQLHHRARQRLGQPVPRFRPDPAHWRTLVERFLDAARGGDVTGLAAMLADNVSSTADGGGKVSAARRTVVGPALAGVLFFEITDDRVTALRIAANPDKLRFLGAQLSHPVGLSGS